MVHSRPALPSGHGELTLRPDYDQWPMLVDQNRAAASSWHFDVGGLSAAELRTLARSEALDAAAAFSAKLEVALRPPGDPEAPLIATGHQPELYHPGVWVKDFLLDRLAVQIGASALDIMVDTDGFDSVALTAPCMDVEVDRCRLYLALGAQDSCFASAAVPSESAIEDFCRAADSMLATLPAPSVRRHFSRFCEQLRSAAPDAENLAEFVTIARRRYEASAGTGYLEAPLTALARTEAFRRFVAHLAFDAAGFARAYNIELQEYRALSKIRSGAQPVPDLGTADGGVELPLWHIDGGQRSTLWAKPCAVGGVTLYTASGLRIDLPSDPSAAAAALARAKVLIAPKALALTLFVRMFACDLFIHGIGGGRYDVVTDGIIRRYFRVEPPRFVVASLTMYLPLGAHVVGEDEVAAAKERLQRLEHNPDALLREIEFDSEEEREHAGALAAEKRKLVEDIASAGAEKKTIGLRIREVNQELSGILRPLRAEFEADLARLQAQLRASDILTDRTYPFCFWEPAEVADKLP